MPNHKNRAHAVLSASSAHRWMNCTPSALATADIPDTVSPYAQEGTKAHEMAEQFLNAYLKGEEPPVVKDTDEEVFYELKPYLDRVIDTYEALKNQDSSTVMFIESRVSFEKWVPEGFGTADVIIISGDTVRIRDLKFGKGVPVDAVDNPQARCYALGVLEKFGDIYDFGIVINEIDQPRLNHFSTEEISVADLLHWADTELKPKAELAIKGEGEYHAGDWCRFCKLNGKCRAKANFSLEIEPISENELSTEEIAKVLSRARDLQSWVKSLEDHVTQALMDGQELPGWKLVEGRSNRQYVDELAVADRLIENGYEDALIYKRQLYGISDMQTLLGGRKKFDEILGDLVIKPEGKPTLVPESDRRPAINQKNIESDFEDL